MCGSGQLTLRIFMGEVGAEPASLEAGVVGEDSLAPTPRGGRGGMRSCAAIVRDPAGLSGLPETRSVRLTMGE